MFSSKPWGTTQPPVGYGVAWGDPINAGLVACWLFNAGAGARVTDLAWMHTSTFAATPPTWGVGRAGKALNFNGSDSYLDITSSPALNAPAITVLALVTVSSTYVNRCILDRLNSAHGYGLYIDFEGKAAFSINGGLSIAVSTAPMNDGRQHLFIGTYDPVAASNQHKIYVDGILQESATYTAAIDYSTAPREQIGRLATVYPFSGGMEQIRILARAITSGEQLRFAANPYAGIEVPYRRMVTSSAAVTTVKFRRTLSAIGTRTGSRQLQGTM